MGHEGGTSRWFCRQLVSHLLPHPHTFRSGPGPNLLGTYESKTSLLKPSRDPSFQTSDKSNGSPAFSTTRSFSAPPSPKTHLTPSPVQQQPKMNEPPPPSNTFLLPIKHVPLHQLGHEATIPSNLNRFNAEHLHPRLNATRERHPWSTTFSTQQHPNRVARAPRSPATELHGHHPFGSRNVPKLRTESLDTRYPAQPED